MSTKNHQDGLNDSTDESDGKMFEAINSSRCPVKTIENFLKHLNPKLDCLFQRPRELSGKFKPENETVWYCNSPVGESTLANMMKTMSTAAGITPHLINHCVRATAVTVLSDHNVEARHIKAVTGHKSDSSIESYNARASFHQKENMSNILSGFVSGEEPSHHQLAIQNRFNVQLQIQNEKNQSSSSHAVASHVYEQSNTHLPQSFSFHGCTVSIVNSKFQQQVSTASSATFSSWNYTSHQPLCESHSRNRFIGSQREGKTHQGSDRPQVRQLD